MDWEFESKTAGGETLNQHNGLDKRESRPEQAASAIPGFEFLFQFLALR